MCIKSQRTSPQNGQRPKLERERESYCIRSYLLPFIHHKSFEIVGNKKVVFLVDMTVELALKSQINELEVIGNGSTTNV